MIQFNLLPDIKIEYIKTQRTKRMVILGSIGAAGLSIALLLVMFSFSTVQKQHITNLDKDIQALRTELEGNQELTKILSVQNQLKSLPALYDGRPAADRLPDYLDQTTPTDVGIGRLVVDFSTSTMEITGSAPSLESVNSYVDTLKFTSYKYDNEGQTTTSGAFSAVILTEFGRSDKEATFVVTLTFDPIIFDATKSIELIVPSTVTTRAEAPASSPDLFDGSATGGQQ